MSQDVTWGDAGVVYKQIPSRPNYWAGSDGSIWSLFRGRPFKRKPYALPNRRFYVCFSDGMMQVSRLVLEAFAGPCPPGMECCHNDGDCQNNRPENLRWDTRAANVKDWHRHGGNRSTQGEKNVNASLTAAVAQQVATLSAGGLRPVQIAKSLSIHRNRVYEILGGYAWSHVTGLPKRSRRTKRLARKRKGESL